MRTAAVAGKTAWQATWKTALVAVVLALTQAGVPASAREARGERAQAEATRSLDAVSLAQLPAEARDTDRLIQAGGPFPSAKDGVVFGNRERVLPAERRGFYREYTVPTPGARNRGARRIVCGGQPPTRPAACYYTDDHYQSFRVIRR